MKLSGKQRAWYLKWLYAKPSGEPSFEKERSRFLREFHVPTAFDLLSEVEAWPTTAVEPEPGELVMQRLFRLFYLKSEAGRGEAEHLSQK
jgi:hypothetical protein